MDTVLLIRAIAFFVLLIIAVILLFVGLRPPIKAMQADNATGTIPKKMVWRSSLILFASMVALVLSIAALHFEDYLNNVCTLPQLLISALISVTKSYGWIVLIPWLLSLFRKPRHRNTNDTDKM